MNTWSRLAIFNIVEITMLNVCLTFSWSNKSFWPQSQVAQLRLSLDKWKCAPWLVVRMCGKPMAWAQGQGSPEHPSRLVESLRVRRWSNPRIWFLSCTKGDLRLPSRGMSRFCLEIIPQLGRNWFESLSLPDSENLTKQRQHRNT
jgi:hypothetical protein